MQILLMYIPGILTAGIDPLGAIDPIAANSSKPAREPCDGNGCVLQLRKVSELSMEPNRSRDLYWSSEATEEEALKAATAATADIGGGVGADVVTRHHTEQQGRHHVQLEVDQVVAQGGQAVKKVVESEGENTERSVGLVGLLGLHGHSPEVIEEHVADW